MLPYPPPYAETKTEENQVLRPLGAILALLGVLLAVLGIIFHQGALELVFALLIAIFSLRIFVLWLGNTQREQKHEPFVPQPASFNARPLSQPYLPQSGYFMPHQPQSIFFPTGTNEMTVPFAPVPTGVPFVPASSPGWSQAQTTGPLPPSVRPPAQTGFFSGQTQAIPPGSFVPPAPSFAPGQSVPPVERGFISASPQSMQAFDSASRAAAPSPYAPGQAVPPTSPGVPAPFAQPGQPVEPWQWGQRDSTHYQ